MKVIARAKQHLCLLLSVSIVFLLATPAHGKTFTPDYSWINPAVFFGGTSVNSDVLRLSGTATMKKESNTSPVNLVGDPLSICVNVFQDFNGNGVRLAATEPLISGVTVTAYASDETPSVLTESSGQYTFAPGNDDAYRIEVTNLPSGFFPGAAGATTVFFASRGDEVDVALENPDQYSQDNPDLVTTCFIEGPQPGGTGETFIRFGYDSGCFDAGINASCDDGGSFTGPKVPLANSDDIGSTYGVAYQRETRSAFVAAFMKRHAGFKTNGKSGVIYRVQNPGTGSPIVSEYIDFDALGIPTQPLTGDPHPADGAAQAVWERDDNSWDWVGKMSFGDLDISEDGETLYVVNLFDRRLYYFPAKATPYTVADAAMVQSVALPAPCGAGVDFRPFGLGVRNGKVYIGTVCSGESTIGAHAGGPIPANSVCNENTPPAGNRASLSANVYSFDIMTGTVDNTPVLTFPLNYGRGLAINSSNGRTSASWNPWVTEWTVYNRPPNGSNFFQDRAYPQPMLTDIEFDGGNMVLGLRDRFGDQTGHLQRPPTGFSINVGSSFDGLYDGVAEGDILRACGDPVNGWTLESGGDCGGISGPPPPNGNSNGPGGGEFYSQDDYDNFHNEVTQGGMVIVPGQEEVVTIMTDPINSSTEFYDAGVVWYRNSDGQRVQNFLVFSTATNVGDDDGPTFAKANGLGDMIALSDPTPIEIGNRLWVDTNMDGLQTAGEPGINGVLVELYKETTPGTFTKVAETTTAADAIQGDGYYVFSNTDDNNQTWSNGVTEVEPNMSYEIRVALADVQAVNALITSFTTVGATTTNDPVTDVNDSDASAAGVIAFSTTDAGENNHGLDIGVQEGSACVVPTSDAATSTVGTCTNEVPDNTASITVNNITDGTEAGIVAGTDYDIAGGPAFMAGGNLDVSGGTANFMNLMDDTGYVIRIFNGANDCFVDVPIRTAPIECPVCNVTIEIAGTSSCVNDEFDFTVVVDWELAPTTGDFEYSINGGPYIALARTNMASAATGESITIPGLTCDEAELISLRFADDTTCGTEAKFVFPPTDPAGYIYCTETGEIVTGGTVSVVPPPGGSFQFLNGEDGTNGRYAWIATGAPVVAGRYTMLYTPPGDEAIAFEPGGFGDGDEVLDPTSGSSDNMGGADPLLLGSDVNGTGDSLVDAAPASNPYFLSFDLEQGDPFVDLNNVPLICTETCVGGPGTIGGTAFLDSENDGAMAGDAGQERIVVEVYDCDGNLVCEVQTNATGGWSCDGLTDGEDYRVEFSTALQPSLQPSYAGVDNGTNVQFAQPGTCEVNYGVIDLGQYCGEPLYLVTPCYIEGDAAGSEDAIILWSYDNEGEAPLDKTSISTNGQVGSTWGLAYDVFNQSLYSATVVKRGVGLYEGADGSGTDVIFATNPFAASPNAEVWLQLTDDLGIATDDGSFPSNVDRGLTAPNPLDPDVYDLVGKVGLGDIEISDDGTTLYVMNLFDRTLYAIDIATKTLVTSYPVPDPGCTNGTYRPWATTYADGTVYIGVVCDASQSPISSPPNAVDDAARPFLEATVYRLDGASFTEVLSTPLDYPREATFGYSGGTCTDDVDGWYGWVDEVPVACEPGVTSYPQPILSDIEFDDAGGMILGFSDRTGFQITASGFTPDGNQQIGLFAGGDILYACSSGGSWTIENPANCTNSNGEAINGTNNTYQQFIFDNGWPRIGEYFVGDFFHDGGDLNGPGFYPGHAEITTGGLVYLPGSNEVVSTAFDPVTGEGGLFNRGGVIKLSTVSGRRTAQGFELYNSDVDNGTAGKGVGLGDLELLCAPLPIQIGNYVWIDEDKDGVQDACEEPLPNLPISLYNKETGVFVAVDTTDANGQYYFDNVDPNTEYAIVFGYDANDMNSPWDAASMLFTVDGDTYTLTQADTGEGNNADLNDSDATSMDMAGLTGYPIISYMTESTTDHSLDVGLVQFPGLTLGSTVFLDNNNDGLQNGADTGIANVEVQLFDAATEMQVLTNAAGMVVMDLADAGIVVTDAEGNYLFSGLAPGDYYVVIPTTPTGAPISSNDSSSGFMETDPDDDEDNDDEGLQPGGTGTAVSSDTITLAIGIEPENEPAQGGGQDTISALDFEDANGNMTLDFGFFAPVTVGDTAFVDLNNDGLQSMGEPGVENVTATIYDNATGMEVDFDAEGNAYTATTTTDANGRYLFENLPPGEYYVIFDISTVTDADLYTYTTNDVDGDVSDEDDSDADPANGQTPATAFIPSGEENLSLDVGIACNVMVMVAEPATICSTQPIDLTQGASITPATLGGTWSSSGDGTFDGGSDFATATTYTPGPDDIALGSVTLTLTTAEPNGPCDPAADAVVFTILKVDCGTFPWPGSND